MSELSGSKGCEKVGEFNEVLAKYDIHRNAIVKLFKETVANRAEDWQYAIDLIDQWVEKEYASNPECKLDYKNGMWPIGYTDEHPPLTEVYVGCKSRGAPLVHEDGTRATDSEILRLDPRYIDVDRVIETYEQLLVKQLEANL